MKTRKGIAAVLAGVMALAALPFSALSAGAESAYAPGDVDMDGYITAHDAAVVSRALYVDETALNDEQKQLADVNGDGVVDQTDADWIYEHSEYKLGAVNQKEYMSSTTLFYQMYYIARKGAGYHDALLTDGSIPESSAEENEVYHDNCITQPAGRKRRRCAGYRRCLCDCVYNCTLRRWSLEQLLSGERTL